MPEFEAIRSQLTAAGEERHQAARTLFRERQRLARLRRDRKDSGRGVHDDDGVLVRAIREQEKRITGLEGRLETLAEAERGRFADFATFTDPRKAITQFSDQTPILLVPLRIETRFKLGTDPGGGGQGELWVRVYPDDIAVDVFEDMLSESEAQTARTYWADTWRAAGREADLRAAWRGLLSGQGSGRSHWVIKTYHPQNEAERPIPTAGVPTVILTIVTQAPLVSPEKDAVTAFWTALWKAGEDGVAQAAASEALTLALGAARSAEIVAAYAPRNLTDPPPEGVERQDTTVIVAYLEFPTDADFPLREAGWAQQPQTHGSKTSATWRVSSW